MLSILVSLSLPAWAEPKITPGPAKVTQARPGLKVAAYCPVLYVDEERIANPQQALADLAGASLVIMRRIHEPAIETKAGRLELGEAMIAFSKAHPGVIYLKADTPVTRVIRRTPVDDLEVIELVLQISEGLAATVIVFSDCVN